MRDKTIWKRQILIRIKIIIGNKDQPHYDNNDILHMVLYDFLEEDTYES